MRSHRNGLNSKERVLKDVEECVESALSKGLCNVDKEAPVILSLDRALRFGLRESERGFWHFIQEYSHSTTLEALNNCASPTATPFQKGIAWLCFTLVEGSLISCLGSLLLDTKALQEHYEDGALLRHKRLASIFLFNLHQLSTVILLLPTGNRMTDEVQGAEEQPGQAPNSANNANNVDLTGEGAGKTERTENSSSADRTETKKENHDEGAGFDCRKRPGLDLKHCVSSVDEYNNSASDDLQPASEFMTSSVLSLVSPVDSGVSLIESDVDNTSLCDGTLENCQNEDDDDDLPFTSLEDSGIIWGDSIVLEPDSVASSILTQIYNDNMSVNTNINNNNCDININSKEKEEPIITQIETKSSDENPIDMSAGETCKDEVVEKVERSVDNSSEEIVFRRSRGRKTKREKTKRVSFHESDPNCTVNLIKTADADPKKESSDRLCYSWCAENLAPFHIEKEDVVRKNEDGLKTSEMPLENESSTTLSDSEVGVEVDCDSSSTLEEITPHSSRQGLYKKWASAVKQFGLNKGNLNKSEPEIFYGSTSSLNSSSVNNEQHRNSLTEPCKQQHKYGGPAQKKRSISKMLKSIKGIGLMPFSERGVPEGQEDPQRICSSVCNLNDRRLLTQSGSTLEWSSDSDWSSELEESVSKRRFKRHSLPGRKNSRRCLWPLRMLPEASSKTSLVNRFLQSIPETKPVTVQLALSRPRLPLYIKGVKSDPELSRQLLEVLEAEMKSHVPEQRISNVHLDQNLTKAIRKYTLQSPDEIIYKVYQVSSLDGLPLLCVLSNTTLYLTGISPINHGFCNHHVVQYAQLNSIIIGPNSQVMVLAAMDRMHKVTVLATLGPQMVYDLLGHLELAVRRALGKSHLAIQQLELQNMSTLKHIIVKQSPVQKDEVLAHYVWVNIGDANVIPASTPLGPTKSGHLMFRPHRHSPWLPGYILLKAGVLYVFADANQRLPNHAVPLHSGQCGGCRRVPNPMRPHTFEIILPTPGATFQLAAADDYEVSDWLQAFVQAASGDSEIEVLQDELAEAVSGCGLLMTTRHILTLSFPYKVLSCAELEDLASIKLAYNCCVLETGCREISEGGGDWVVYFATDTALEEFLDHLVQLQPSLADSVVMMSESDPLNSRCEQTSRLLEQCWDLLLHPQLT